MRILVTGASGLLGSRVVSLARERKHEVLATYNANPVPGEEMERLDVTDTAAVFAVVRSFEPDAVVHAAAMTNVDECERNPDRAMAVNGRGTENLAMAARELGAKMIYVSTDYVFDGTKDSPYLEYEAPAPLSYYGHSKLRGELSVRNICSDYAIARTSVLYGWNAPGQHANFATWVMGSLKKGERIKLATDQLNSPTLVEDCAAALLRIVELDARGIFHTCGRSCVSRHEFGLQIAREFGLDTGLITPAKISELSWAARRPAMACLSVERTERELGMRFRTTQEGLALMREQMDKGRVMATQEGLAPEGTDG